MPVEPRPTACWLQALRVIDSIRAAYSGAAPHSTGGGGGRAEITHPESFLGKRRVFESQAEIHSGFAVKSVRFLEALKRARVSRISRSLRRRRREIIAHTP
jgi:hypothetical protein